MSNRRALLLILFNVAAIGALLAAAEGVSRWIKPVELPAALVTRGQRDWAATRSHDPLLFWRMRPGIHRERNWAVNSLGLRGAEVPEKGRDEFRILSLGESSTFGWHVAEEETYSSLLDESLAALDRNIRVINAGVAGYSLFQGVTYFEHRGLGLEPDLVLVYFGINDFLKVAFRAERDSLVDPATAGLTDRELFAVRQRPVTRVVSTLWRYSNLARLVSAPRAVEGRAVRQGRRSRVPAQDRRWLLERLRRLCADHQVELVVVIPWYRFFDRHAPLLREAGEWDEALMVDLPAELADLEDLEPYFVDRVHPSPAGHREIARVIDARLREWAPWDRSARPGAG